MQGDSLTQRSSTFRNSAGQSENCRGGQDLSNLGRHDTSQAGIQQASRMAGPVLHQPSFSKAALELQVAFPIDKSCAPATEFSFPNRWRARSQTLQHPKYVVHHGLQHPRGPERGSDGSTGYWTSYWTWPSRISPEVGSSEVLTTPPTTTM